MINLKFKIKNCKRGFTLIELLIVIAIIAIIATVVFVALNPLQRFKDARNSVRQQNISAILSAIKINQVDNRGNYLESIRNITADLNYIIGTDTSGCDIGCTASTTQSSCVDLTGLVTAGYIRQIPIESNGGTSAKTLYYLNRASTGVVSIGACMLEVEGESTPVSWNCGDTLTDSRDGQTYATVLVGSQCWMAKNLNYGTMTAGTNQQGSDCSSVAETEKYCYSNTEGNCTTDGALYQWAQMMCGAASCNGTGESQPACTSPVQGICPTGWHIPSHYEYTALEREVCDSGTCATDFPYNESATGWRGTNEGGQMKGTTICGTYPCWNSPNTGATNSSGLTVWPAGYRHYNNGFFYSRGSYAYIWSSSESDVNNAWRQFLHSGSAAVSWGVGNKSLGFSVRCLKD